MSPLVKTFCFALVLGSALAGGRGGRRYRGAAVYQSEPVYQKTYSAPIAYKSVSVPAVQYAPAAQYVSSLPAQYAYAAPHAHAYAAPHAHAYAAPHGHLHSAHAAYAIPAAHYALLSTAGKPQTYGKSINAAAIRNVETVMVTKTITPVVTKTTTHHTSAEPALSVGHVQGYSQAAVGHAKLAPVQFNTQYTSYANPTVGVNGPVVYSGQAVGIAQVGVAAAPVAVAGPEPVVAKAVGQAVAYQAAPVAYQTGQIAYQAAPVAYKTAQVAYQAAPVAYKTAQVAYQAAPVAYQTVAQAPQYQVLSGAALSYDNYGLEAHSVPLTNFLEVQSGKPVLSGYQKK